jgi:exodeoxyribonuclease V alpha subunit
VARLLLTDQPGRRRGSRTAPTGKAAARLAEAVRTAAAELSAEDQRRLGELTASTLHRLLGWLPEASPIPPRCAEPSARRDHRRRDVDGLTDDDGQAARATRPDARLILVGDPDRLLGRGRGGPPDIAPGPGRGDAGS